MKLIKKLTLKKNKNNMRMLDECLLNQEAIPAKQNIQTEMKCHAEGEYVIKEDGVYLRYVVNEGKTGDKATNDENNEINV